MDLYSVRGQRGNLPSGSVEEVAHILAQASLRNDDKAPYTLMGMDAYESAEVGWAGQQYGQGDKAARVFMPQPRGNGYAMQRRQKRQDAKKGKNYRRLWEQATKVGCGQQLEGSGKLSFSEMSVEDLVRVIQNLPADTSVVLAVSQALCYLDSRALAALLKELAKVGCASRAVELFDWLRNFEPGEDLAALCDVYTYTTMVSLCGQQRQLRRGIQLVTEMRARGIQCNVHTYSALMNVCIKCGELDLAIDVYKQMKPEGCQPNVVTFNTLIDVYGKTGKWEEAVNVLSLMQREGLEPEIRTYNTAIIACNMCGQPEEALKVYERLVGAGHTPIATTYTALISAYGKSGQLHKALQTFQTMIRTGCERNIITYNALLATCERGGEWELALRLFNQMHKEGCHPNTVSFNSLINVCAQSGKWEKAAEIFDRMKIQNCKPDSMTYTALLHAFEMGGQWHKAVGIFEQMVQQGCRLDTLVHHTIIDLLWQSGVVWAQGKALQLFNSALRNYHVRLGVLQSIEDGVLEASVPSLSVGVAILSLLKWLSDTRHALEQEGVQLLGNQVVIVVGRTKNSREQSLIDVKDSVVSMLNGLRAPTMEKEDTATGTKYIMNSDEFSKWLCNDDTKEALKKYVEDGLHVEMSREILAEDKETEERCKQAFLAVREFEFSLTISRGLMSQEYLDQRRRLVHYANRIGNHYKLKEETIHDVVFIMDRIMSTGIKIQEGVWAVFVAALVFISAWRSESEAKWMAMEGIDGYVGFPPGSVGRMEEQIISVLCRDTSAISAIRVLKLYFERLGIKATTNDSESIFASLGEALLSFDFIDIKPSIVAAALLYRDRELKGKVKLWPSSLMHLTGITTSDPDFQTALSAARKLESNLYITPPSVLDT